MSSYAICHALLERLGVERREELPTLSAPPVAALIEHLREHPLVCLSGPSGCGKTRLLQAVQHAWCAQQENAAVVWCAQGEIASDQPLADWLMRAGQCATLDQLHDLLLRCGLLDPTLLQRPVRVLSVGERERAHLARAIAQAERCLRAGQRVLLLADELCSGLDDLGAQALMHAFGRWLQRASPEVRTLVISHRQAAISALCASRAGALHLTLEQSPNGSALMAAALQPTVSLCKRLRIDNGTRSDWHALAAHHYRGRKLGPVHRIYRASLDGRLVGVVVVGFVAFGCRARRRAFPRLVCTGGIGEQLRRWNSSLRCVQRVVVHPTFRGCGIGEAMLRHVVHAERDYHLEAHALHPGLFRRAGFVNHGLEGGARSALALAQQLSALGVSAADLARSETRAAALSTLAECKQNALLRAVRASLRPWLESRSGALRGSVSASGINERAWARLPEMLRRSARRTHYLYLCR